MGAGARAGLLPNQVRRRPVMMTVVLAFVPLTWSD
jgi:hypothetical protein